MHLGLRLLPAALVALGSITACADSGETSEEAEADQDLIGRPPPVDNVSDLEQPTNGRTLCKSSSEATRALADAPLPDAAAPDLTAHQAIAFMNGYFRLWNDAAKKALAIKPAVLERAAIDEVMTLYKPDLAVVLFEPQRSSFPRLALPAGSARTHFVEVFFKTQRGAVHKAEYVCVSKNQITVGFRLYLPIAGKTLDPVNPNPADVAASFPLLGSYVMNHAVVESFTLSLDGLLLRPTFLRVE